MDRKTIHEFVKAVAGPNIELVDHSNWVSFRCLLARWTHQKRTDNTPSAGISINEDGESVYHCYACTTKARSGPLVWLLRQLEKYSGDSYRDLIRELDGSEFLGGALPEWGSRVRTKRRKLNILDDTYLDLFEPATGHPYLRKRGIDDGTAQYLGLCVDPEDYHGAERIVFPVYTADHGLVGFTGRAVQNDVEPRVRDYYGLPKDSVLLGAHLVQPDDPFVVVVEGPFDLAKVVKAGLPAVATMHAGMTAAQQRIMRNLGLPVTLMLDNDAAGRTGAQIIAEGLLPYLPVSIVRYPKRGVLRGTQWVKVKDPGALRVAEIQELVSKAKVL